jgi:hypothetical protein
VKKRKKLDIGRVDYRLLMLNKSKRFADKRTRRARTRGDSERRSIEEQE